jgi:hypothetical protein
VDDFLSFCDDVSKREALFGDNIGPVGGGRICETSHATADAELDRESMVSPTTVASVEQMAHGNEARAPGQTLDSVTNTDGDRVNFQNAFQSAFNLLAPEQPKQIWETGIWKHIFGSDSDDLDFDVWGPQAKRPVPSLWGVEPPGNGSTSDSSGKRKFEQCCTYMEVVSFRPDVPWKEQREADLQRGLNLWMALTSKWADSCSFIQKLSEMQNETEQFNMFAHLFAGRAPTTVRKRGAAILKLCDFLDNNRLEAFPMSELVFYRFLCAESSMGAPTSRLRGYLQAITFCRHVMDVVELQPIIDSRRCKGTAHDENVKERKQASPLSVQELLKLHAMVEDPADSWNALFAGAALLCCYCRGRWGDLMRSEMAFMDYDDKGCPAFLETRTGRHKTMAAQMHRHQFLPMVAPVRGVNGKDWATPWIELRRAKGLAFPPEGLVMPAPDQHGQATERPLESGECGKWLRKLLDVAHPTGNPGVRRVSSHSLKCTMLSFAAKRGLPVPDRLMLGYHSSNMQMSLVYSRDGAAASLLLLERLIDEIVKGKFRPDSTRSGRIVESPVELPGPQLGKVKVEVVDSSDDEAAVDAEVEESSDSTSDSSSSDQCIPQDHSLNKVYAPPEPPSGFSRWQHSKLKTLHLTAEGYVNVFVCGRRVGSFHHRLDSIPRFDSPVCWACFNKAKQTEKEG